MQNVRKNYPLTDILKKRDELLEDIKDNYQRIKLLSRSKNFTILSRTTDYNLRKLISEQKDLRDKIVKFKILLNEKNAKIYPQIVALSELKTYLNELKMTKIKAFEGEIKMTEKEISQIEESLTSYNNSTQVAWWNLIELNR